MRPRDESKHNVRGTRSGGNMRTLLECGAAGTPPGAHWRRAPRLPTTAPLPPQAARLTCDGDWLGLCDCDADADGEADGVSVLDGDGDGVPDVADGDGVIVGERLAVALADDVGDGELVALDVALAVGDAELDDEDDVDGLVDAEPDDDGDCDADAVCEADGDMDGTATGGARIVCTAAPVSAVPVAGDVVKTGTPNALSSDSVAPAVCPPPAAADGK